ncbi:MAG: 7-cyano-7-deazaguanine synthase QueC [Alphaproteobacteria bacterium]
MSHLSNQHCLVLFSGGQDSTTCLAWALSRFSTVETIGFHYGQRHHIEMSCRQQILSNIKTTFPEWRHKMGADHVLSLDVLGQISETSLTRETAIAFSDHGLPSTFVPGRNLIFFTFAAALAYRQGCRHLVGGMCETDYSGYPDCRDDSLKALQVALNMGMDQRFVLHTPLMWVDKKATWDLAEKLGGQQLVNIIIEETHSCYKGDRQTRHDWGYGCNDCPACTLRQQGYAEYTAARAI